MKNQPIQLITNNDLKIHTDNFNNPHKVKSDQVSLSNSICDDLDLPTSSNVDTVLSLIGSTVKMQIISKVSPLTDIEITCDFVPKAFFGMGSYITPVSHDDNNIMSCSFSWIENNDITPVQLLGTSGSPNYSVIDDFGYEKVTVSGNTIQMTTDFISNKATYTFIIFG